MIFKAHEHNMCHNVRQMYLRTCVPSEESDQPTHSRSLIRIFNGHILITKGAKFLYAGIHLAENSLQCQIDNSYTTYELRSPWPKMNFCPLVLLLATCTI